MLWAIRRRTPAARRRDLAESLGAAGGAGHRVAGVDKQRNEQAPDHPGRAGKEDLHRCTSTYTNNRSAVPPAHRCWWVSSGRNWSRKAVRVEIPAVLAVLSRRRDLPAV